MYEVTVPVTVGRNGLMATPTANTLALGEYDRLLGGAGGLEFEPDPPHPPTNTKTASALTENREKELFIAYSPWIRRSCVRCIWDHRVDFPPPISRSLERHLKEFCCWLLSRIGNGTVALFERGLSLTGFAHMADHLRLLASWHRGLTFAGNFRGRVSFLPENLRRDAVVRVDVVWSLNGKRRRAMHASKSSRKHCVAQGSSASKRSPL